MAALPGGVPFADGGDFADAAAGKPRCYEAGMDIGMHRLTQIL